MRQQHPTKCPRCGLISPSTAQRCDCGYDFQTKTLEKSYFTQELPKTLKNYLVFVIILNVLNAVAVAAFGGGVGGFLLLIIWSVLVYSLYGQLVRRKPWAKNALIVLTFPLGSWLLLTREVRLYMLQKR